MHRAAVSTTGTAALRRSAGLTFVRPDHNSFGFLEAVAELGFVQGALISRKHLPAQGSRTAGASRDLVAVAEANDIDWILDCATPGAAVPDVLKSPVGDKHRSWQEFDGVNFPVPTHRLADAGLCRELADRFADLQETSPYVSAPYFEMPTHRHGAADWNLHLLDALAPSSPGRPLVAFLQTTRGAARAGLFVRVAKQYVDAGVSLVILRVRGLTPRTATGDDVGALLKAGRTFRRLGIDVVFDCSGRLGAVLAAASGMAYSTGAHNFRGLSGSVLGSDGGVGSAVTYEAPSGLQEHAANSIQAQNNLPDATPAELKIHRLRVYDALASLSERDLLVRLRQASDQHRQWADAIVLAQRLSA